ncbi:hypothetical protein QYF36_023762 [Acer negundo]|nr:hypothetical protein QYF36_023762 [Acer negundo]
MSNLSISAPNLIKLFISRFNYVNNFHPKHIKDRKIAIESAPRLEFVDFSADQPMELSIHECPKLDKVNIRMPPPVAWRETNSYSNSYRFDVICMDPSPSKSVIVSLNFSQVSNGEHLWFFDGVKVLQSIPCSPKRVRR